MRAPLVATILAVGMILPVPGTAGEPAGRCRGTLSGAVKREFRCSASVVQEAGGPPVFTIVPLEELAGVPSYVPGSFEIPAPPAPGSFTLDTLGMGRAVVALENGTLYSAAKTSSQRGEVRLDLRRVKPVPSTPGSYEVEGRFRARLLPAASARKDDVVVEVSF